MPAQPPARRSGSRTPTRWPNMDHLGTSYNRSKGIYSTKNCTLLLLNPWPVSLTTTPEISLKSSNSEPSRDVRSITQRIPIALNPTLSITNTVVPCHVTSSQNLLSRPKRRTPFMNVLCTSCKQRMSNVLPINHVVLPILLHPCKLEVHICHSVTLRWCYQKQTVLCRLQCSCYQEEEDGATGAYQHLNLLAQ